MTHTASGSKTGVPKGWLLPAAVLVVILLAAVVGWLSRSVVIDFVAWWPVWVLVGGLAFFAGRRKRGAGPPLGSDPAGGDRALGALLRLSPSGLGCDALVVGITGGPGVGLGHQCRDVGTY